ncbi:MAG TPA: histidine phosphatase family protein [Bacillus sp. (in: firmicutes)]|uniref:histidine phosphatase family protein n=1 Tax=Bacillus litorisediminis TaxID=2922713 RepID=UPI001FAB6CDA|nr:histidine phosphatase family protein [Bacillus litorisediminis]HWO75779.1 histidine phosphatase family protein [Bacillus sp. (in: firmicutes)]
MTKICLVRHGETDWNAIRRIQGREEIPLNDKGKKQAEECGQYLKNLHFDVLISSPMVRAKQTAELINTHIGLPAIIEMADFMERDYGVVSGMTIDERKEKFPDQEHPSIESWEALSQRVMKGIDTIHEIYQGQSVLLVVHGGVINAILGSISNEELGHGKTKIMNGSITNIENQNGIWVIHEYNRVDHLSLSITNS